MIYYTIYKTTNKVNGKVYIGAHKTKNLNDNYMGSGKYLNYAITKHGIDNFTKDILYTFDNPEEMFTKEAEIVTVEFIAETNTYNLKVGGFGGWDYINNNEELRIAKNRKARKIANENGALEKALAALKVCRQDKDWYDKVNVKRIATIRERYGDEAFCSFKGQHHTQETKNIIGANSSKCQQGSGNSQHGTMWVTNGTTNKKIKKDSSIPKGFRKGRVLKQK